jgi:hypothetical protein
MDWHQQDSASVPSSQAEAKDASQMQEQNACQLCRFHGIYIEIKQSNHF